MEIPSVKKGSAERVLHWDKKRRGFVSEGDCFTEKTIWLQMAARGSHRMRSSLRTKQIVAGKVQNKEEASWGNSANSTSYEISE